MGTMASRTQATDPVAGSIAASEDFVGSGQFGRSQKRSVGDVLVRSWNYALVHSSKRIVAEHS